MTPQDATRRHAERYLGTLWTNYWPIFAHLKCVISKCQKRIEKAPPFHWNQAHSLDSLTLHFLLRINLVTASHFTQITIPEKWPLAHEKSWFGRLYFGMGTLSSQVVNCYTSSVNQWWNYGLTSRAVNPGIYIIMEWSIFLQCQPWSHSRSEYQSHIISINTLAKGFRSRLEVSPGTGRYPFL